ncbi:MAG: T9SS C-terminal target domain-containing protein [Cytophagales bacterium]|nr:MAG: T9SS C-terminal target domain-containing protein [Cytophagales bacterium]
MVGGRTNTFFQVPVKATVYNRDDGTGEFTDARVEAIINRTNEYFRASQIPILLYLVCNPVHINQSFRAFPSDANFNDICEDAREANPWVLNAVFFIDCTDFGGRANFPHKSNRFTFLSGSRGGPRGQAQTFIHEVGHCLGLLHTHESYWDNEPNGLVNAWKQEPVSRTARLPGLSGNIRCEVRGDYLCDTHADPGMRFPIMSEFAPDITDLSPAPCIYNNVSSDADRTRDKLNNERWDIVGYNAPNNIMSYSSDACARDFTPMQGAAMLYILDNYGITFPFAISPPAPRLLVTHPVVDKFENDNYWANARMYDLLLPQRQHRTFHSTPGINSTQPMHCDEDWVYFTLTSPRRVIIRTSRVMGTDESNTSLNVFGTTLDPEDATRLGGITAPAFVSDDNPLSNFSRIDQVFPAGTYAVRISNNQTLPNMNYFLTISLDREFEDWGIGIGSGDTSIGIEDGGGALCVGEQLTATGVPEGCVARWSTNTTGLFLSESGLVEPATNIYILTINGGVGFPAEVTLEIFCDGQTVPSSSYTFPIWIGIPAKPTLTVSGRCRYETEIVANPSNEDEYQWHATELSNPGSPPLIFSESENWLHGTTFSYGVWHIKVRTRNRCGWSPYSDLYQVGLDDCDRGDPRRVASLSPNPATNQVTVSVDEKVVISPNGLDIRIKDLYAVEKIAVQSQSHRTNVDISSLPHGVYVVYIQNGQHIEYLRLVVE